MGVFVGHEPCPECGSKDNLARYDDGSAWCFGCHYYERPTHFRPAIIEEKKTMMPPADLTSEIPEPNLSWLRQYLNDKEIQDNFKYSPSLRRHVYLYHNSVSDLWYWEGRSVIKEDGEDYSYEAPKSVAHGEKPFLIKGPWSTTGKLVVVEDIISAIKLSRWVGALPLFGSFLSGERMAFIAKMHGIKQVIFWLDQDKYKESLVLADKMSKLKYTSVTSTKEDPKALPEEEILELLELS